MMFLLDRATEEDVQYVIEHIDQPSAKAIEICGVGRAGDSVRLMAKVSTHTVCASVDGQPIAIFGVMDTGGDEGSVWLVAVDGLGQVPVRLLAQARRFVKAFLYEFKSLRTIVWEENSSHVRWVEWLGFSKVDKVPYGKHGELFYIFKLEM